MSESIMSLHYDVCADDFKAAGEASSDVKNKLKVMGFPPDIVRRVAIAMYEGEINMVIHANGGERSRWTCTMDEIIIVLKDVGPGIKDIDKAMEGRLFDSLRPYPFAGLWRRYGTSEYEVNVPMR